MDLVYHGFFLLTWDFFPQQILWTVPWESNCPSSLGLASVWMQGFFSKQAGKLSVDLFLYPVTIFSMGSWDKISLKGRVLELLGNTLLDFLCLRQSLQCLSSLHRQCCPLCSIKQEALMETLMDFRVNWALFMILTTGHKGTIYFLPCLPGVLRVRMQVSDQLCEKSHPILCVSLSTSLSFSLSTLVHGTLSPYN